MTSNEELQSMTDRYLKLVDLHGQIQMQNSVLEDRLLSLVENSTEEKQRLETALIKAQQQIRLLQETVEELQSEKQRYKDDCNLAVRLLHRNPHEFLPMVSDDIEAQMKKRCESPLVQRPVLVPTFPPTFFAVPTLLTGTTNSNSNRLSTENVRRTAETLFKSNSVHRFPTNTFVCSHCERLVKQCDVSVQTSSTDSSRSRLVSVSSTDEGNWISLDSPSVTSYRVENECPKGKIQPITNQTYCSYSTANIDFV